MSGINVMIDKDSEININFIIAPSIQNEGKETKLYVGENEEKIKEDNPEDIDKINFEVAEKHFVVFRYPSYADANNIMSSAIKTGIDGEINLDLAKIRNKKMSMLLKSWSFKDVEGKEVLPTMENLDKLHPAIGLYLGSALDDATADMY